MIKMVRTGPTNIELRLLISELKKQKEPIFKRLASELSRPSRQRRAVNLSRINTCTKIGEVAVVPGNVLSSGELAKKLTVAGWKFSNAAVLKIKAAGGEAILLKDLMEKKSKKMRLIG